MSITREELVEGKEYLNKCGSVGEVLKIGNNSVFIRWGLEPEVENAWTIKDALKGLRLKPKPKVKKWLWMKETGVVTSKFYTEDEVVTSNFYTEGGVHNSWTKTNCYVEVEE